MIEPDETGDDLKVLQLKMEVPAGFGRFLLKPLHIQVEPVERFEVRQFFDTIRSTRMFWMYGQRKSVFCTFNKHGLDVLRPFCELIYDDCQRTSVSCE